MKIAKLRAERAALLGYANHAAYALEDATAHDIATVNKLLAGLAPAAVANARKEAADMQAMIDRDGGGFQLAAWDWAYYAEKVRAERYAFDESQLRPYFEMKNVLENGVTRKSARPGAVEPRSTMRFSSCASGALPASTCAAEI